MPAEPHDGGCGTPAPAVGRPTTAPASAITGEGAPGLTLDAAGSGRPNGAGRGNGSASPRPRRKPGRRSLSATLSIVPRDIDEAYRVARAVLAAKLAPGSYVHERGHALPDEEIVARLVIGILKGAEIGFPPITALSAIALINRRPCIYGDGASALLQARGHLEAMTIEEIGTIPGAAVPTGKFADDFGMRVSLWRRGQRQPYSGQFTVGDAKRARLWLDPRRDWWIKYPKRQLKWRAFAWPARDGFADDLMGLGIAEEMLDVKTAPPSSIDTSFLDD